MKTMTGCSGSFGCRTTSRWECLRRRFGCLRRRTAPNLKWGSMHWKARFAARCWYRRRSRRLTNKRLGQKDQSKEQGSVRKPACHHLTASLEAHHYYESYLTKKIPRVQKPFERVRVWTRAKFHSRNGLALTDMRNANFSALQRFKESSASSLLNHQFLRDCLSVGGCQHKGWYDDRHDAYRLR